MDLQYILLLHIQDLSSTEKWIKSLTPELQNKKLQDEINKQTL